MYSLKTIAVRLAVSASLVGAGLRGGYRDRCGHGATIIATGGHFRDSAQ